MIIKWQVRKTIWPQKFNIYNPGYDEQICKDINYNSTEIYKDGGYNVFGLQINTVPTWTEIKAEWFKYEYKSFDMFALKCYKIF